MNEADSMTGRIGCFFLLVGVVLVAIFMAVGTTNETVLSLLCWGALSILLGLFFWNKGKGPSQPSERFSAIRKMQKARAERSRPKAKK